MSNFAIGYPVKDAQLDALYQAETSRIWNEQQIQAAVPVMRKLSKEELADVSATVQVATDCFKHGLDFLSEGIDKVSGSADADKLASLYDQMADIRYEVEKIRKGWGF